MKIMKVLYVGHDKIDPTMFCAGSLVCMSLVDKLDEDITVQDCTVLREAQELPEWLNGTPILIDGDNPVPTRGTDAVRMLQAMIKKQNHRLTQVPKSGSAVGKRAIAPSADGMRPQSSGVVPRMHPVATRQPSSIRRQQPIAPDQTPGSYLQLDNSGDDTDNEEQIHASSSVTNAQIRDEKVTDDDLQRYMEARKQSAASATAPQPV